MTDLSIRRAQRLEKLLDVALDLDESTRAAFLISDTIEPELRDELVALLQATTAPGALDYLPNEMIKEVLANSNNLPVHIEAGQKHGRYRLIRLLGEGGMASVWLAEREADELRHQVAVKYLKTGLATPEARKRFLREQQILAQLQHPHIARLYDTDITDDGVPFIVMEWVDGSPLNHYCDEKKLGIQQRLRLFQKICTALAYAHQNLIVHRDLKPANILVDADGEPKLLDFGIAKLLDGDIEPMTRSGFYLMTPQYAAPEQLNNGPITTATDVYALGGIFYELLCGLRFQNSWRNRSTNSEASAVTAPSEALRHLSKVSGKISADLLLLKQLGEQRSTSPERLWRNLQGDLDTIAMKALQEDAIRRYPTVQALNEDIARYLSQQPIQARKDAWVYRAGKFLKRHAIGAALSVIVALTLLTATAVSLYHMQRAETETQRALAIKDFLTDLFKVSDIGLPRDQVPTTEMLFEDGAKRIRSQFNNVPELKFDLLLLLGRIERDLDLHDAAGSLLKEARIIAEANFSPANEKWLQAQTEWARMPRRYRTNVPIDFLATAIAKHRNAGGPKESFALADALNAQSRYYLHSDQFDKAVTLSQEVFAINQRLFGDHHPETQQALMYLGEKLQYVDHWDEAEIAERTSVAMARELYGNHDIRYADSLSALAMVLAQRRKGEEAEPLAREALAIEEMVYAKPNLDFTSTLEALGLALMHQHKLDEAEAVYQRALNIQTQLNSAEGRPVPYILDSLADIAKRRQHYQEAERLHTKALALARRHYGARSSQAARALNGLGQALTGQQRYPEALSTLQEAMEIRKQVNGDQSTSLGEVLHNLAEAEIKAGHPQQALEYAKSALHIYAKPANASNPALAELKKLIEQARSAPKAMPIGHNAGVLKSRYYDCCDQEIAPAPA